MSKDITVGLSKMVQMLSGSKANDCTCPSAEEHTCPFASEIHGDDSLCNCCPVCEQECAEDI